MSSTANTDEPAAATAQGHGHSASTLTLGEGSTGEPLGGSQALVLGTTVSPVSIVNDQFSDLSKSKLAIAVAGVSAFAPAQTNSVS